MVSKKKVFLFIMAKKRFMRIRICDSGVEPTAGSLAPSQIHKIQSPLNP